MTPDFAPHPDIRITVDQIGQDRAPVMVVDNFVADPQALCDFAASDAPFAAARKAFPGVIAPFPMPYAQAAFDFLNPLIRQTFGFKAKVVGGGASFQMMTSAPRQLHPRQLTPHTDCASTEMIGTVHYLCRPGFRGTGFYRHNRTGFEIITAARVAAYEASLAQDLAAHPPEAFIDGDTPIFSRIGQYDAVFNRIILFRGAVLHSGGVDAAGDPAPHPTSGRLTANMFVQFAANS